MNLCRIGTIFPLVCFLQVHFSRGFAMASASRSGSGQRKAKSRGTGSRHVVNDVLGMASVLLQSRRDAAVEQIEVVAQAVRDFSNELDGIAFAQDYAEEAAEALDDLAVYVGETEPAQMLTDLEGTARRNPAITLAFVVFSGIALT